MSNNVGAAPPPGTRWREEEFATHFGEVFFVRYANGWQRRAKNDSKWYTVEEFSWIGVPDHGVERVWALRKTPTEPLPGPQVDRNGGAWEVARKALERASYQRTVENPEWRGRGQETDVLLRALADHVDEIAALVGKHAISAEEFGELDRLRKITEVSMGVGSGDTGLFVYGTYEAIKAAQERLIMPRPKLLDGYWNVYENWTAYRYHSKAQAIAMDEAAAVLRAVRLAVVKEGT